MTSLKFLDFLGSAKVHPQLPYSETGFVDNTFQLEERRMQMPTTFVVISLIYFLLPFDFRLAEFWQKYSNWS